MRLLPCLVVSLALAGSGRAQAAGVDPAASLDPVAKSAPVLGARPSAGAQGAADPKSEGRKALPVPEPNALLLVGTGLLGVALVSRLRRRSMGTDD